MHQLIYSTSGLIVLIIVYHLQCKKVQQELCKSGAVEQFIHDPRIAKRIRSTFMEQYSLEMVSLMRMYEHLWRENLFIFINQYGMVYHKCNITEPSHLLHKLLKQSNVL